jgi:hypothetical protein
MDGVRRAIVEKTEWPEACDVVDVGDAVIITFTRSMGRTHHHIRAPLTRVLRVLRDMGWVIEDIGRDAAGRLQMQLHW